MTNGERLYKCLLAVKPMQFSEGGGVQEPRTPWEDLTVRSQWSREEWERIAEDLLKLNVVSGQALYACVLRVCPMQRRQTHEVPRRRWHEEMLPVWQKVVETFKARGEVA